MELVLQINKNEPSEAFATEYLAAANNFVDKVKTKREAASSVNVI